MLLLGTVGNLFYFWMGLAVVILLWIPVSHHAFRKRGKFIVMPAGGMAGSQYGSTRRTLIVFTAVRLVIVVILIIVALGHVHSSGH